MFTRVKTHLVITTNNLMAMEAITQWIYAVLYGTPYFIEIEKFPDMILCKIYISCSEEWDEKLKSMITEDMDARRITIWEELT